MSGNSVNLGQMFAQYKEHDQLTAVEAGTYDLEIVSCKGLANGVRPVYKVVGAHPRAGAKVMAGGFYCSDASRSIFFRNMTCLGFDQNYFTQNPTFDDIAKALVGRVIKAELTVKQWQGEDRNEIPIGRIQLISAPPLPGVGGAPMMAAPATNGAAPPMAAPAVAPAPAVAAPAPAPVAEVPVAAPAAVAQPAPVVAPAPVPAAVAAPAPAAVAPPSLPADAPVAAGIPVTDPGF